MAISSRPPRSLRTPISTKFAPYRGKRVLVTGAGGFIGSHLVEELVAVGAKVTALFRYTSHAGLGHLAISPCLTSIIPQWGDVRDSAAIARAVADQEIIFHLAAHVAIPYSYLSPQDFVAVNIGGTTNVLETARHSARLKRLVVVSTSEVYGTALRVPMDESHPTNPQSPYAASKLAAEKMASAYALSFGIPLTTVRPFNVFGPRQSPRAVVPAIIIQALRGKTIHLGRTDTRRDFTFVSDTVESMMRLAITPKASGQTVNIASEREASVAEIVQLVGELIGAKLTVKSERRRVRPHASEVDRLLGSAAHLKKLCGTTPRLSLSEGLVLTIASYKKFLNNYAEENYQL